MPPVPVKTESGVIRSASGYLFRGIQTSQNGPKDKGTWACAWTRAAPQRRGVSDVGHDTPFSGSKDFKAFAWDAWNTDFSSARDTVTG